MPQAQTAELNLNEILRQVAREKDIDLERWIAALEDAMASAAKKQHRIKEPVRAHLDRETGKFDAFIVKKVVETVEDPLAEWTVEEARDHKADAEVGDEIHLPISTDGLGRIAAQRAKQVLYQRVREAERENIYNEYIDRVGELDERHVKRFERGDMIIDLSGKTEADHPALASSRAHERYSQGERIRAVIVDVHKQPKGPQIVLSRTDPRLLIKLFEMEVPEIYDGTVVIKGAVREPGERAKIAVMSARARRRSGRRLRRHEGLARAVDHPRAARREDRHHSVYSDDLVTFAQNALAPAKITRVSVTSDEQAHGAAPRRHRRGRAALARHRQARPERAPRRGADRREDRHQERERRQGRGGRRARPHAADGDGAVRRRRSAAGDRRRRAGRRRRDGRTAPGGRLRHARGARSRPSRRRCSPEVEGVDARARRRHRRLGRDEQREQRNGAADIGAVPRSRGGRAGPMGDEDFMAALSRAFQESEQQRAAAQWPAEEPGAARTSRPGGRGAEHRETARSRESSARRRRRVGRLRYLEESETKIWERFESRTSRR